jgi:hypothetical protein
VYLQPVRIAISSTTSILYALLALVEQPELGALVGVDDGEDLGDTLADVVNAGELGVGASGDLSSPESDQLPSIRQYASPSRFSFVMRNVRLEIGELAREVLLGLVPQLGGLLQRL